MIEKISHTTNSTVAFEVEGYHITLHRYKDELSLLEDNKRLISYVDLICNAGKKYLPELIEEKKKCA